MNYSYFDIHSHFNLESFDADLDQAIAKLEEKSTGTFCVGIDKETSKRAVAIAHKSPYIFAIVGLHPQEVVNEGEFDYDYYLNLGGDLRVVAIGECGLDYFRIEKEDYVGKDRQKAVFQSQIDLALELNLPLMLHIRPSLGSYDAYLDVLEILEIRKKDTGKQLRGDAHFFVGSQEIASRFLALGFTVSFTGVITITHDYDELVRNIPIDMMMAETDSPFVAPVPYRGRRAEPWMVEEVYKKISELKGIPLEELIKIFDQNRKRLFKI